MNLVAEVPKTWQQIDDQELLQYFYDKAVRLTNIKALSKTELPPIYLIPLADLNIEVCPEDPANCRNLAAVFDDIGYRILVRDDFEISQNFIPYDYSFVIHEVIHALQFAVDGPEIFKDCDAIYETEKVAYEAQDKYLREEGSFHQVANILKFGFYCDDEVAKLEYEKSKKAWNKSFLNKLK